MGREGGGDGVVVVVAADVGDVRISTIILRLFVELVSVLLSAEAILFTCDI